MRANLPGVREVYYGRRARKNVALPHARAPRRPVCPCLQPLLYPIARLTSTRPPALFGVPEFRPALTDALRRPSNTRGLSPLLTVRLCACQGLCDGPARPAATNATDGSSAVASSPSGSTSSMTAAAAIGLGLADTVLEVRGPHLGSLPRVDGRAWGPYVPGSGYAAVSRERVERTHRPLALCHEVPALGVDPSTCCPQAAVPNWLRAPSAVHTDNGANSGSTATVTGSNGRGVTEAATETKAEAEATGYATLLPSGPQAPGATSAELLHMAFRALDRHWDARRAAEGPGARNRFDGPYTWDAVRRLPSVPPL